MTVAGSKVNNIVQCYFIMDNTKGTKNLSWCVIPAITITRYLSLPPLLLLFFLLFLRVGYIHQRHWCLQIMEEIGRQTAHKQTDKQNQTSDKQTDKQADRQQTDTENRDDGDSQTTTNKQTNRERQDKQMPQTFLTCMWASPFPNSLWLTAFTGFTIPSPADPSPVPCCQPILASILLPNPLVYFSQRPKSLSIGAPWWPLSGLFFLATVLVAAAGGLELTPSQKKFNNH